MILSEGNYNIKRCNQESLVWSVGIKTKIVLCQHSWCGRLVACQKSLGIPVKHHLEEFDRAESKARPRVLKRCNLVES